MKHASAQANTANFAEPARHGLDDGGLRMRLGYQLRRADLAMQQAFAREIGETFNLRQVEFSVLALLATNDAVRHKQISEVLGVAPSNMVGVMSGLEQRQLIKCRPDPSDGRSRFWLLTEPGRKLEREVAQAISEMEHRFVLERGAGDAALLVQALDRLW
ncbi:MarR family winged helix-turn-helix transcriptional regulator [Salinisphaera hydrothermalis]|uniref:MarR family transcriptional regulator n=1 Tax=Salinisphaera hydrothermalis (strain C41B8) TaxID=1304275 RepID=A0A084IPJ3_SALHC|nr:MarR family transcriptional regulator [Salinisphaera hydrothermalis]KEZ78627.1 marR family transcriptional regulator [Salinisphaera hydrothermalis C41B8]